MRWTLKNMYYIMRRLCYLRYLGMASVEGNIEVERCFRKWGRALTWW
jgi:hypothetical protein